MIGRLRDGWCYASAAERAQAIAIVGGPFVVLALALALPALIGACRD